MFKSARIKLTAWYVAIIMLVTVAFSVFMFSGVERGTRLALEAQRRRIERQFIRSDMPQRFFIQGPMLDSETIMDIRNTVLATLIIVNIIVLATSSALGYFLAGKTLAPIEEMVKKQKRFISDAAHEIKTPLAAMKTDIEVTLRDKDLNLDKAKNTLNSTVLDIDKLNYLTSKLAKQSKYQISDNLQKEEVDLNKLIEDIAKKLKPLAEKKHEIVNISGEHVNIWANKDSMEEMFTNIIENSIKYNEENKDVNVEIKKENNWALIKIQDFGKGINKEDLPYIFEPFYRADKSRTNSTQDGYGLGLTIAKEIVERHNGYITVENNNGAIFKIGLPLSASSQER